MRISDWSSDVCSSDLLLIYCWLTTLGADFPKEALDKWDWVWKALAFAIFLPLTLRPRLRIEALLAFMIVAASTIIIVGGITTLARKSIVSGKSVSVCLSLGVRRTLTKKQRHLQ